MNLTDRRRHAPVSDRLLARRVLQIASGLHAAGLRAGDRVLIAQAPGPTRTAVAAACRRLGAEVVLVDPDRAGRRVLRSARPDALVAGAPVLLRAWGLPGVRLRLATSRLPVIDRALGVRLHLADVVTRHLLLALPPEPEPVRADPGPGLSSGMSCSVPLKVERSNGGRTVSQGDAVRPVDGADGADGADGQASASGSPTRLATWSGTYVDSSRGGRV